MFIILLLLIIFVLLLIDYTSEYLNQIYKEYHQIDSLDTDPKLFPHFYNGKTVKTGNK